MGAGAIATQRTAYDISWLDNLTDIDVGASKLLYQPWPSQYLAVLLL